MNIILLSGGGGQRLWPLSGPISSKQFIRLFSDPEGNKESILQRLYRQITVLLPDANVVIATGRQQEGLIREQLGEVPVCIEPERKDTFSAIALATAYLRDRMGVSADDCVTVCPADAFVDDSYFFSMQKLHHLAEAGTAKIMLMGVAPSAPSDKYGYIIPVNSQEVSPVKEFKEKPNTEKAAEYMKQNGLWNAGVFSYKVGYLMELAFQALNISGYQELYSRYSSLEKISFDYAVVEKENDIGVLRHYGEWRDVGTWNVMAETMAKPVNGDAVLDDTCVHTQVVNELELPILCMGCQNMVIAAGKNGILIADKERSGQIKPYVDRLEAAFVSGKKPWGTYTVIDTQPGALTAKIHIYAGQKRTGQILNARKRIWTVVAGKGWLVTEGTKRKLAAGDSLTIAAEGEYELIADTSLDLIEIELQTEKV